MPEAGYALPPTRVDRPRLVAPAWQKVQRGMRSCAIFRRRPAGREISSRSIWTSSLCAAT